MSATAAVIEFTRRLGTRRFNVILIATYTTALFFSAVLLFSVQPIFAKIVLPTLGGSPSVWAVSMCFFQAALLVGYGYAHLLTRFLPLAAASCVHIALLSVAFLALPFDLPSDVSPPTSNAYLWLVGILVSGVGLPFFALSANAPLLQAWFARSGHPHASDPYFLYGASNLGSLLALLSYPIVLEPLLGLTAQARIWSNGFFTLALFVAACAALLAAVNHRRQAASSNVGATTDSRAVSERITLRQRLSWIGLAFVPSGLLVAYTSYLATDIASAPFIWVIPLATFLATFVLIFRSRPFIPARLLLAAQPFLVAFALLDIAAPGTLGGALAIAVGFAAFFVTTMVAHGELYAKRPASADLTEFYMWMSLGGVLGGIFAALIAPQLFNTIYEFPLLLVAGMLCRPGALPALARLRTVSSMRGPLLLLTAVAAASVAFASGAVALDYAKLTILGLVYVTAVLLWTSRAATGQIVLYTAVLGLAITTLPTQLSHGRSERSFYGVHKIAMTPDGQMRLLIHGTTVHGAQRLKEPDGTPLRRPRPATYYYEGSLMARGLVAARQAADKVAGKAATDINVAIVGVGTGSLACYARPQESWRFYEIDPVVIRLATDPKLFTFFSSCIAEPDFVVGDARLTLAREPAAKFDYLVIDAFSSDAVPVHLLTREAFEMYLAKLAPAGIIALHVSNQHMDLRSSAIATARSIPGVHVAHGEDVIGDESGLDRSSSRVIFLSRSEPALAPLLRQSDIMPPDASAVAPWTDDYSNVLSAILRKHFAAEPSH